MSGFCSAQAQIDRDKVEKKANHLFQEEKYFEAKSLYQQLLEFSLNDYNLNFKYGACMLFTSHNKSTGLARLNYAIESNDIDNEAWFFLGHSRHINYQFSLAIEAFDHYISNASKDDRFVKQALTAIEQCKSAQKLLKGITQLKILKKREMKSDVFFRLYDMDSIGGLIIQVTDEIITKLDKKNNHKPIVHFPPRTRNSFYFSSYGSKGNNGLDLYRVERLPNGEFSEPEILPLGINTKLDERYPFLSPDGKWIYFSSQGHNSMGGFDVFRASYNAKTNEYGPVQNMDFPINSPGNDILYVHDSLYHKQYFTTDRASSWEKVHVYQSNVQRLPETQSIIIGNFTNDVNPSNKEIKITLFRTSTKEAVASIISNKNGDFQIPVEQNDTLTYQVEVLGNDQIHSAQIILPKTSDNLKLFRQSISLALKNGVEQLVIKNFFDFKYSELELEAIQSSYFTSLAMPIIYLDESKKPEPVEFIETKDLTVDTCGKIFKHYFSYNENSIDDLNNPELANFVECFRANVEKKGKIKIFIESSASKVPTKTYKTNDELAIVRKNLAVGTVMKFLRTLNTSPDAYQIIVSHKVQGPAYKNDYLKNKAEYEKWQYVIIQLE